MSIDTLDIFQKVHYQDAVRSNLFYVYINFPAFILGSSDARTKTKWLIQATSLPGRSSGVVEVPFRGLKSKLAGNSIYPDWSCTFLQDPKFTINNAIEGWQEYAESAVAGIRGYDLSYKSTIEIVQLDGRQNAIKNYILLGAFPSDKSDIPVAQDDNDSFQTLDAVFSYDYFLTSVSL